MKEYKSYTYSWRVRVWQAFLVAKRMFHVAYQELTALSLTPGMKLSLKFQHELTVSSPAIAGKDVVYVPTPQAAVDAMIELADLDRSDRIIDLGSGDGRTVVAAAKKVMCAYGAELNPDLIEESRELARKEQVTNAIFMPMDFMEVNLEPYNVIFMYLLPGLNMKLRDRLRALQPGTRIVSHAFDMGDWFPDKAVKVGKDSVFLWVVK